MYSFKAIVQALVVLATLFITSSAWGLGLGANLTYANHTSGDLDEIDDEFPITADGNLVGFGFTLDTNLAGPGLMNYRLEFDYEYMQVDFGKALAGLGKQDSNGFGLNQTLGFRLFRNRSMKLWAGPAVRLGMHVVSDDVDAVEVDFGAGLEIGVNFHLGERFSVAPTLGYQYMLTYVGFPDGEIGASDFGFLGGSHRVAVGVSFLFRGAGDSSD